MLYSHNIYYDKYMLLHKNNKLVKYMNIIHQLHNLHKKYIQKKFEYSHAGQDVFALNLTGKNGTYIEIGAYLPIKHSNTYLLEVKNNWRGISIEFDKDLKKHWLKCKERLNQIYFEDALSFDYINCLKANSLPTRINYLSCDIDPAKDTFKALKKVIEQGVKFDFISFEHDHYWRKFHTTDNNDYQSIAIEYLCKNGYKIAIDNVYPKNKKFKIFETWFVNSDINFDEISYDIWKKENL